MQASEDPGDPLECTEAMPIRACDHKLHPFLLSLCFLHPFDSNLVAWRLLEVDSECDMATQATSTVEFFPQVTDEPKVPDALTWLEIEHRSAREAML